MEVASTAIREIDYEAGRRRLTVRFQSGEAYVYAEVPKPVHRAFLSAESKGRFFQTEIRRRYPYRRLTS
jgi:hypothetical protein